MWLCPLPRVTEKTEPAYRVQKSAYMCLGDVVRGANNPHSEASLHTTIYYGKPSLRGTIHTRNKKGRIGIFQIANVDGTES